MTTARWNLRFRRFSRAVELLAEPLRADSGPLSALEEEGVVHRFETAFELAWKTLRDYLESEGIVPVAVTPRSVIKEAFAAGVIQDGQTWIDMLDHRNLLSHTYDEVLFKEAARSLRGRYLGALESLVEWLSEHASDR